MIPTLELREDIGCVASIFDTLMVVARLSAQWANRRSIERKKKSRKLNDAPWIYASSYVPSTVPWSTIHHLTIPHYELGVLQFKTPNEHKFDRLLASTRAVFDENEYISTRFSKNSLLGVTFRQVVRKINYARSAGSFQTKLTLVWKPVTFRHVFHILIFWFSN